MAEYNIFASGCAPKLFPTETFYGLLYYAPDEALEIPKQYPFNKGWGKVYGIVVYENEIYPMPRILDIIWLAVVERKFYSVTSKLPYRKMEQLWQSFEPQTQELIYSHIVVGMAPYGGVAVWINGEHKVSLIAWLKAEEVKVSMSDFMPTTPDATLDEVCRFYIENDLSVKENLMQNGLPPRDLFDNYMKQFTYRYQAIFGKWDEEKEEWLVKPTPSSLGGMDGGLVDAKADVTPQYEFDHIEEALFDGTHDKLHDGGLMKYHEAGKPKKLAVQWHMNKREWTAYFWFEDEEIRRVYDRFYGTHPDTKTDFIIRIDSEKNKYELALYRYGLREPQVIPENVYQLLVFRNKFECFRSENYNQERGAWIW